MSKGSPVVEHSTRNPEVQGLNLAAYTGKKYTDSCMEVPLLQISRGSTVVVHSTYDAEIEGFNTDARTGGKIFKLVSVILKVYLILQSSQFSQKDW